MIGSRNFKRSEGWLTTAAGTLVFGVAGRGPRRLDEETTPEYRQGLERRPALLFLLCGFPEIHTRARQFKALMLIEDPFYVLGTRHVYDPRAESMAALISHNLSDHHRSKWDEA